MYSEIIENLRISPATYFPALLRELIRFGYSKDVWVPGGASKMVGNMEKELEKAAPVQQTTGASTPFAKCDKCGEVAEYHYCHEHMIERDNSEENIS